MSDRPQETQTWIDAIATPFDRAWRASVRRGGIGQRPRIEDCLGALEEPRRCQLLEELLRIELDWRREAGEAPTSAEYQSRFPGHAGTIEGVFAEAAPAPLLPPVVDGGRIRGDHPPPVVGPADANAFGGQARREQPAGSVRASDIPTTAPPPDAGVSFYLGSRTPAAAALSTTSPPQSGSLPSSNHEWGGDRYAPIRELGRGGFGVVYEAEDRELLRKVALKLPTRPRLTTEQDAIDFLLEARILARLDHPGIVPVHDVGRAPDGSCYVVSKYIEGEDLGRRLKRRGRLEPKETAELVRQVASALHHAHEQGLVHRDIKPANILLRGEDRGPDSRLDASLVHSRSGEGDPEGDGRNQANSPAASTPGSSSMGEFLYEFVDRAGRVERGIVRPRTLADARKMLDADGFVYKALVPRDTPQGLAIYRRGIRASAARGNEADVGGLEPDRAYVADFGLALKTEDVQLASQFAGTPAYMSPEQISPDASQLDGRSDIFSLGVVFYELLVGERPFHGKSVADLRTEICSGTPKSPDRWHPDVPATLGAICMKCLAKPPADRFQTAKQLADALHQWLTDWNWPSAAISSRPTTAASAPRAGSARARPSPSSSPPAHRLGHLATNASSMRELLGYFFILIAFFAGLVGCLSLWATFAAGNREGSLFFGDIAWRSGIVAGMMAWLGIYTLRSRMRANRSGPSREPQPWWPSRPLSELSRSQEVL
jgi:serine/threonine protein kinase